MNNLLFVLYKSENFKECNIFEDRNIALLSLLKLVNDEFDILVRLLSFKKNVLSFNKINEIKLYCFIKNSSILFQEYSFDISSLNIIDGLSNVVGIDGEYKYAYHSLIKNIKSLHNQLKTNTIYEPMNVQVNKPTISKPIMNKPIINKPIDNKQSLQPSKTLGCKLQDSLRNLNSKEEFKKKIMELREKQKIKREKLDEIKDTFKKEEKKYIDIRNKFESDKKDATKKREDSEQKIREFKAGKRSYFLMKNDIEEEELKEKDINPQFKKSYYIFKDMENNNEINSDDDSEDEELIHNQFSQFSEKYKKVEENEMINKFLFDKKIYYSIKKDIENGEIYESDVPTKFSLKYLVYKTLDKNKVIKDEDTKYTPETEQQILPQFKKFVDLYERIQEIKEKKKIYTT